MNYQEAMKYMEKVGTYGIVPGLDSIRELCRRLGNPQDELKFVHIADMHFDSPFVKLSDKDILGDLRRLEQRKVFKKIIEYIKDNNIRYFFISGDLYENKYVIDTKRQRIYNVKK